jgi:F-type H+-transporting ATPase subunit a
MNLPEIKLGHPEPTLLHFLVKSVPIPYAEFVITTAVVIVLLTILLLRTTRRLEHKEIGRWQALWELTVSGFVNFVEGIMGPGNEKFVPLIGTLFIFILSMNLFGIIPGFISPTASLNTTIALALTVFVVVQVAGIRSHGFKSYFMHFVGDPWQLGIIMFPLHIIGELAKPLSLSLRLAGNVFAEDAVIAIVAALSPFLYLIVKAEWAKDVPLFPMQILILPLMLLFGVIQAFVFSMLSTIYISLMVGESHEEAHGELVHA